MPELTDVQDEIGTKICAYVDKRPDRTFKPSELARVAGCRTWETYAVLGWLIEHDMLAHNGRGGSWRRYRARRFGEYPSREAS